jgi:hypothetical protein
MPFGSMIGSLFDFPGKMRKLHRARTTERGTKNKKDEDYTKGFKLIILCCHLFKTERFINF